MTQESFLQKARAGLEKFFENLPQPLIQPVWYPGEPEKLMTCLEKWGAGLRELVQIVVETLSEEGFFDENPIIRVYPRYPEASGIVVFHKGQKVFEKWLNTFEWNWNNKQQVTQEASTWYDQMRNGMSPEEYEYYEHPWERDWR